MDAVLPITPKIDARQSIRLASANVGSLHTGVKYGGYDDIVTSCGRLSLIDDLFHSAGLDVVAVHEGRFREEQQLCSKHYNIYAAAAENGSYGSQIWLHVDFKHHLIATIISCSRLLSVVLTIDGSGTELGVVAAHGPHSADGRQKISDFWVLVTDTINDLRLRFPGINIALLTDANARVGSVESVSIGSWNSEIEHYPGKCFRMCVEDCKLKVMSTFFHCSPSWFHVDGSETCD